MTREAGSGYARSYRSTLKIGRSKKMLEPPSEDGKNYVVWQTTFLFGQQYCKKKTNSDLNTNIQAGVGLESKHFYIDTTSSILSHQLTLSHSFQPCSCWCQEVGSSHSWPLGLKDFLYFLKGKTLAKHFMNIWSGACSQCRLK